MDFAVVNTYSTLPEAYIDKGFLDNHGLHAQVQEQALSELFPAPGAGLGSISLLVPENEAAEAVKLLESRPSD